MKPQGNIKYQGRPYRVLSVIGLPVLPDGRYYYDAARHAIDYQEVPGIGSADYPAPQATLMSVVISGILTRRLPWTLVLFGAFIAIALELCGGRSLASVWILSSYFDHPHRLAGGFVPWIVEHSSEHEECEAGSGALFSSGLVAGGSLGGLALAVVMGFKKEAVMAVGNRWFPAFASSDLSALLIFIALASVLFFVARTRPHTPSQ